MLASISPLEVALASLYLLAMASSLLVCALKGKYGMLVAGLFFQLFWFVGAIRLAKPDSWWAREIYGPTTRRLAQDRF